MSHNGGRRVSICSKDNFSPKFRKESRNRGDKISSRECQSKGASKKGRLSVETSYPKPKDGLVWTTSSDLRDK